MEMDCKLKTLANFFKFLVYFGEIAKNIFYPENETFLFDLI